MPAHTHTRLAIITANELGLAFTPRNLPKKCRPDPSTFYLVIVVTDKQTNKHTDSWTDRQTYAGDSIILAKAFAGIINVAKTTDFISSWPYACTHTHTTV